MDQAARHKNPICGRGQEAQVIQPRLSGRKDRWDDRTSRDEKQAFAQDRQHEDQGRICEKMVRGQGHKVQAHLQIPVGSASNLPESCGSRQYAPQNPCLGAPTMPQIDSS